MERFLAALPPALCRWSETVRHRRNGAHHRRRQAEEAIRDSEERYRTLFDMAPVGIIMVDPADGAIVAFNRRAHETLGYAHEEFATMSLADVEVGLDKEEIQATLRRIVESDATIQFETRHRRKDGRIVEVLVAAHRLRVGGRMSIYKTWLDITQQKNVERQLQAAKEEAEQANRAKSQFLAAASHDLRQPVQSLMFFHSALSAKLKGHPAAPLLDNMQTGLDALKMPLDGLLDISKLHAGTIDVAPSVFPLSALFARLESEYVQQAADKGLELRMVQTSLWVRSDMALIERIVRNLLDNALKYTPKGAILLGCRRRGDSVRLDVVDTGVGIPDDRREDIFREFVQLGNPERDRAKGLGLGLAIVRHLAALLGHEVTLRSRIGHGTTFSVTLPLARARLPRRRGGPATSAPTASSNAGTAASDAQSGTA